MGVCLWRFFLLFKYFIQKLTWMLLRQFHLTNNLMTHGENTHFPQQKPRELPSAEVNFEGWKMFFITLQKVILSWGIQILGFQIPWRDEMSKDKTRNVLLNNLGSKHSLAMKFDITKEKILFENSTKIVVWKLVRIHLC